MAPGADLAAFSKKTLLVLIREGNSVCCTTAGSPPGVDSDIHWMALPEHVVPASPTALLTEDLPPTKQPEAVADISPKAVPPAKLFQQESATAGFSRGSYDEEFDLERASTASSGIPLGDMAGAGQEKHYVPKQDIITRLEHIREKDMKVQPAPSSHWHCLGKCQMTQLIMLLMCSAELLSCMACSR